jgi:hypothetical protein
VTDLFATELRHLPVAVLDPAHLMACYIGRDKPVPADYGERSLREIAEVTGCQAVVFGAITEYFTGKGPREERLALVVTVIDPVSGDRLFETKLVATGAELEPPVRGMDELTLLGVRRITQEIARAR